MRVAVVGAGPAGLYFARLLKRSRTSADVHVLERGPDGATWGFGVGVGGRTISDIQDTDQEVYGELVAAMRFTRDHLIHLNGEELSIEYAEAAGAVSRLELLQILTAACRRVGVSMRFETPIEGSADLNGYDLIVAADGANSRLRAERETAFGTRRRTLTNHFAWYGVARAMEPMALIFRSLGAGAFVGHYYAYTHGMSTFVTECDDVAWREFGLDRMTDEQRQAEMERVFAPELGGEALVANHSIWRQFPAVTNERFHNGNVVLLGDSLGVAHFSIGSGTRLAMEDAAALHQAFETSGDDVETSLELFEQLRRPGRDKFGEAARRSFEWYEDVARRMQRPLVPFIHDFLTRTGRISDERLRSYAPGFYEAYRRDQHGVQAACHS